MKIPAFLLLAVSASLFAAESDSTVNTNGQAEDQDDEGVVSIYEWSVAGDAGDVEEGDTEDDRRTPSAERVDSDTALQSAQSADDEETGDRRVQFMSDNLSENVDFSAYDTDGNGVLDRGEASDNSYLVQHFDEWDADDNGLLDPHEAESGWLDVDQQ